MFKALKWRASLHPLRNAEIRDVPFAFHRRAPRNIEMNYASPYFDIT
jgi:hypothetical protein